MIIEDSYLNIVSGLAAWLLQKDLQRQAIWSKPAMPIRTGYRARTQKSEHGRGRLCCVVFPHWVERRLPNCSADYTTYRTHLCIL